MERIAVLTSGGDAPGMNACIRAVVRTGIRSGLAVYGVCKGYEGLIDGDMAPLSGDDVSGIIQRGGTILHSARSERFRTGEGREQAARSLAEERIDGVVLIGGDGTFRGGLALQLEHGIKVVGVPATIDNDISGTDFTLGYDTAVNTALEAIDKIRDTAAAHDRLFIVEVMGRDAGHIALDVGIGSGAEAVLVPETPTDIPAICEKLRWRVERGRTSSILVVAEGDEAGNAYQIAEKIRDRVEMSSRVTVLGHVQRGGSPTANDRMLGSRLGWAAVDALLDGAAPCMVGELAGTLVHSPLERAWTEKKGLDPVTVQLTELL